MFQLRALQIGKAAGGGMMSKVGCPFAGSALTLPGFFIAK